MANWKSILRRWLLDSVEIIMSYGAPVVSTQTVNNSVWTSIKPAKDCNIIKIQNSSGQTLKIRSDLVDSTTEFTMADGEVWDFEAPKNFIYRAQDILFYAQIGTGSSSIRVIAI